MNYQESISRLEEASVFGIKPGLERSAAAYGALPAGAFGISTAHTSTGYRVRRSLPGCRHTNIGSTYSRGRAVLPA